MPFAIQIWLFATPVAYSVSWLARALATCCSALNPMAASIEGFRWALLGGARPAGRR